MSTKLAAVVTTIQKPTEAIFKLNERIFKTGGTLIIIGDKKGPKRFNLDNSCYYSYQCQLQLKYKLAKLLPPNHYARKNLGYLIAMEKKAHCIYETDDDNIPAINWKPRKYLVHAQSLQGRGWKNVYRAFSEKLIWPRGFPIELVRDKKYQQIKRSRTILKYDAPIQQGLADGSPDVDAIWRMVLDSDFRFEKRKSIYLGRGNWSPFNSQCTWWWQLAYPLMYLPSYCSFRMTDIWRSFVAQRCLWELGYGVVFHAPEVFQKRNVHNLMTDFRQEIDGYISNKIIIDGLNKLILSKGKSHVFTNMKHCYKYLVNNGFIPEDELPLLEAYLYDVKKLLS